MRREVGPQASSTDVERSGAALVIVVCLLTITATISGWLAFSSASQIRRSRRVERMEQAFYLAEAGAERAASTVASGAGLPLALRGTLGAGQFIAVVVPDSGWSFPRGRIRGRLRVNPNLRTDFAFFVDLPSGQRISHLDLRPETPDYSGAAQAVAIQPMGAGTQTTLEFDDASYTVENSELYSMQSTNMTVRVYNDNRTPAGAIGEWWVEINATNAWIASSRLARLLGQGSSFNIFATGKVGDLGRAVFIRGVHRASWSRYAMWYDQESTTLWIAGGEVFAGPVYSSVQMRFHDYMVATLGQARFLDRVSHVPSNYVVRNSSVNPIFERGITLNAPSQSMFSVDLNELRAQATLVLSGATYIAVASNRMFVTNERRGWTNQPLPLVTEGLLYVAPATSGNTNTMAGDIYLSAVTGLQGRLTVVADRDIYVTNHVRYSVHPTNTASATDAFGIIAGRHVVVTTNAPNNLEIFGHIICRDGGFGVARYDDPALGQRGMLTVYGGIANKIRQPVGTTSRTGYLKNYTFDTRFLTRPPPRYPSVPDELNWLGWDG